MPAYRGGTTERPAKGRLLSLCPPRGPGQPVTRGHLAAPKEMKDEG
jgi:hypothetical protein